MAGQGDVINTVLQGTFGNANVPWSMVLDYRITAINTAGSLATWGSVVSGTISGAWVSALLGDLADDVTFDNVAFFNRNDETESAAQSVDIDGTGVTDGLPLRNTVIIQKNTGLRGRSYRGRMSFPALLAANQDNGVIDSGTVALLVTFASALRITGNTTDQGHMVVYSPTLSTDDVVFSTLVDGFTVRSVMGSLRSRQATS